MCGQTTGKRKRRQARLDPRYSSQRNMSLGKRMRIHERKMMRIKAFTLGKPSKN